MGSSSWFPTPSPRRWTRTGQTLTRYHPQWPDPGRPKLFQATLGRASFDRTHRFVFSTTWTLPSPSNAMQRRIVGGWAVAGVATIQSGTALTIADTNPMNVFGISEDKIGRASCRERV